MPRALGHTISQPQASTNNFSMFHTPPHPHPLPSSQVHEQGEMAMRIDENVDDALVNVESGQAQLLKYLNTISSNRWLIMKVFFVLVLFLLFFIVFIA
jgi:syntaxin 5